MVFLTLYFYYVQTVILYSSITEYIVFKTMSRIVKNFYCEFVQPYINCKKILHMYFYTYTGF